MKKVFVLVNEWVVDTCDSGTCVRVFETLSHAVEQMWADAQCWEDDNMIDGWEKVEGKDSMSIDFYEDGRYCENHIGWHIVEQEVEQDPENDFHIGDRVIWNDPARESEPMKYVIFDIRGDIICISNEYGEAEVYESELTISK